VSLEAPCRLEDGALAIRDLGATRQVVALALRLVGSPEERLRVAAAGAAMLARDLACM
jgi:hypothetical protein